MKTENELRAIFKKQHDCVLGSDSNIYFAMTEDRFLKVMSDLNFLTKHNVIEPTCGTCSNLMTEPASLDYPWADGWCRKKHFDGISNFGDLDAKTECKDFNAL